MYQNDYKRKYIIIILIILLIVLLTIDYNDSVLILEVVPQAEVKSNIPVINIFT